MLDDLFADLAERRANDHTAEDREIARKLLRTLFKQQREFVLDPCRQKAALCSRRAGKSYSVLVAALVMALSKPGSNVLVIAKTRKQVKGVYWSHLKRLVADYGIRAHFRNVELEVEFANGSMMSFSGADTEDEIEKFRGQSYDLACIDEAKSYSPDLLDELLFSVIRPALADRMGTLMLIGTPGAILAGPFFEITTLSTTRYGACTRWNGKPNPKASWSVHSWTAKENVAFTDSGGSSLIWREFLETKKLAGWADDDPTWLREYCGVWVPDDDALVYAYVKTNVNERPLDWFGNEGGPHGLPDGHDWQCILGVDLGYHDATAFVVAAWAETHPQLFYVHSEKHNEMTVEEVAKRVIELEEEFGGFTARVADTGGLGKMLVESMATTYGVHFEAAQKTEKHAHIKLLNSDIQSHRIRLDPQSPLAEEWRTLQWRNSARKAEDPQCPNHCADAALYVWRYAYHHFNREAAVQPEVGTSEWWREKEDREMRELAEKVRRAHESEWWKGLADDLDTHPLLGTHRWK